MAQFKKPRVKSKTFWAGVTSCVGGIQGLVTGVPDLNTSIMLIVGGLIAIFMREAIENSGPNA